MFDALAPQIVIVEMLLSGGVGGRLIERLKGAGATVIAVSPLAASDVAAEFGAAAFVQKPIDPLVLVSTVRDLLRTSAISRRRSMRP
jgi:DNA-binding response OmpR family regulator